MAEIADAFAQWMRDYVTDGVPASGVNPPDKAEGRAIGPIIEAYIDAKVIDLVNTILGAPPTTPGPYVMPAYVTSGAIGHASTSANVPFPAVLADDVALLQVLVYNFDANTPPDPARPSGWTQMGSIVTQGQTKSALYWKRCDGAETGNVTVLTDGTGTVDTRTAGVMTTWRGCVANGDPFEALDTNHGAGPSMPSRSVTTLGPQRLVVNLWCARNGGGYALSGADTGFTEVLSDFYTTFNDSRFVGDVQTAALAQTIGVDTRSLTSNQGWAVFSLALLPSS